MEESRQLRLLFALAALLSGLMVVVILMDSPGFPLPHIVVEVTGSASSQGSQWQPQRETAPVHLNTATKAQLETLPGIGPVTAQRILDHRSAIGRFTSVEQLLEVERIGEKTLEKIRPYLLID